MRTRARDRQRLIKLAEGWYRPLGALPRPRSNSTKEEAAELDLAATKAQQLNGDESEYTEPSTNASRAATATDT